VPIKSGYRQEVFNVILAQLLQERGVITAPEKVLTSALQKRRMPDVIVDYHGLRIVIEGEVDDQTNAREKALTSAKGRVDEGIAHIGIAIVYPSSLRKASHSVLKKHLSKCHLEIAIISESGVFDYTKGDVGYLESALRRVFESLVKEDTVSEAVAILEESINNFSRTIVNKEGVIQRTAEVLGIKELPSKDEDEGDDE